MAQILLQRSKILFTLSQDKPIEEMMRLKKEDIDKPISQADLDAALERCKKTSDDVEVQRYNAENK